MSSSDFSSNPKTREWFENALELLAGGVAAINERNEPSRSVLFKKMALAFAANPAVVVKAMQTIMDAGDESYAEYRNMVNALRGRAPTDFELPNLGSVND